MKNLFLCMLLALCGQAFANPIIVLEPPSTINAFYHPMTYPSGFDESKNVYGVTVYEAPPCGRRGCTQYVESCTWDGTGASAVKADGGYWTIEAPIQCTPGGVFAPQVIPSPAPPQTVLYIDQTTNVAVGYAGVRLYGMPYVVATQWNPDGTEVQWLPAGQRAQGWDSLFYANGVTDTGSVCGGGVHDSGGYRGFLVVGGQ